MWMGIISLTVYWKCMYLLFIYDRVLVYRKTFAFISRANLIYNDV